jgi:DNA-binding CsgD family transcriptional regulator/predicted DNA-binding transcriptional regulator
MPLSETAIRHAVPTDRSQKLADGGGLYLLLNPNGSRWWRLKYRFGGREKLLSLGTYPATGLRAARIKRDEARQLLAVGIDPGAQRKAEKAASDERMANSHKVKELSRELLAKSPTWSRSLEALGIDDMEERVYRILLSHRMATAEEVGRILSLSTRKTQRLLDNVESKGLVSHSPERPRRYIAASPKLAVEALASQRQADIERTRLAIPELMEHMADDAEAHDRQQAVELITSRAALSQILVQLRQTIQHEAFGFQCAPLLYPGMINRQEMAPGVRIRSVSDAGYLAFPGALDSVRLDMARGEEARFFSTLPAKMYIVDRRVALIPMNPEDPGAATLLVRASSLLDALCAFFEVIWERATPIVFTGTGEWKADPASHRLTEAAEQLIPLLAAGLNDKAIAHEAEISATTVNRRIAELMKSFGTRSRFQLGWRAALDVYPNGWPQARSKDQG